MVSRRTEPMSPRDRAVVQAWLDNVTIKWRQVALAAGWLLLAAGLIAIGFWTALAPNSGAWICAGATALLAGAAILAVLLWTMWIHLIVRSTIGNRASRQGLQHALARGTVEVMEAAADAAWRVPEQYSDWPLVPVLVRTGPEEFLILPEPPDAQDAGETIDMAAAFLVRTVAGGAYPGGKPLDQIEVQPRKASPRLTVGPELPPLPDDVEVPELEPLTAAQLPAPWRAAIEGASPPLP
jgi:hypothetical protein